MRKFLMMSALLAVSAIALAIPANVGAPITGGIGSTGSTTEIFVTANVVEGVAVNQSAPIDFGNLPRGLFSANELVRERTRGIVSYKGTPGSTITTKFDTPMDIELDWFSVNGTTEPTGSTATLEKITGVKVNGGSELTGTPVTHILDATTGTKEIYLTASFAAGGGAAGNLSTNQKLGAYRGKVIVSAEKI